MKDLDAPAWRTVYAAGGDVVGQLRAVLEGGAGFRENLELLAENLSHQLSWYSATSYVLPHLAALCERLSLEDRAFVIAQTGAAIAAEAECPLSPVGEDYREFHEGLDGLRAVAADLIQNHMDVLDAASDEERQMFCLGALAVLGERKHACGLYDLSGYCWEEGPAACDCGWEEECLPLAEGSEDLEPAVFAPWDGKSLEDEGVWLNGLLTRFGDEIILPVLPLVYGTGTCPDCGKREPYWAWMERWKETC